MMGPLRYPFFRMCVCLLLSFLGMCVFCDYGFGLLGLQVRTDSELVQRRKKED